MNNQVASKPLFIVGVPRSGTTLLRELLTQHSLVAMPKDEFQLLPYFFRKYEKGYVLAEADIASILLKLADSPFYFHLKGEKPLSKLNLVPKPIEEALLDILRYFSPEKTGLQAKWLGEKTPNNLLIIDELAARFEGARFIHVVRDPRDVALSMNNAWGKSLTHSILAWERSITKAVEFENNRAEQIHRIRYEDLIADPELALKDISQFLGIDFEESTSKLLFGREKMGDAAGLADIKKDNSAKYKLRMSADNIACIDGRLASYLNFYEYPCSSSEKTLSTNPFVLNFLKAKDFLSSFRWHIKDKGLISGVQYRLKQAIYR